jgi:Class II flagellar assembly regulator
MQGVGRVTGGMATPAGRGGGRAGFSVGAARGQAAARTAAAGAVAPLALGMLALQERSTDAERDAAARRRADSLLEELQALQAELLTGRAEPGRLARLAALEGGEEGADPALREVVQAVVLRARVEMARRGWGSSATSA